MTDQAAWALARLSLDLGSSPSTGSLPERPAWQLGRRPTLDSGRDQRQSPTGREPGGRGLDNPAPGILSMEPWCHRRPPWLPDGQRIAGEGSILSQRLMGGTEGSSAQGRSAALGLFLLSGKFPPNTAFP
jgi:hypothetical protein